MNSSIEAEIFIRKKIPIIYKILSILIILLIAILIFILNLNYQSVIKTTGIIKEENNQYLLMLTINKDELKYIINNNYIKIDNSIYYYKVYRIDEDLYIDEKLKNYKVVYLKLKLSKEYKINNLAFTVKINKENKKIIDYVIDYLLER